MDFVGIFMESIDKIWHFDQSFSSFVEYSGHLPFTGQNLGPFAGFTANMLDPNWGWYYMNRCIVVWLVVWNINFIFPYIGNFIIPIDFHIFQRGGPTTNQWFILHVPWLESEVPFESIERTIWYGTPVHLSNLPKYIKFLCSMEGKEKRQLTIGPLTCYWIQSHSKSHVCSLHTDVRSMRTDAQPSLIQLFLIMSRYDMALYENVVPPATPWSKTSFFSRYTVYHVFRHTRPSHAWFFAHDISILFPCQGAGSYNGGSPRQHRCGVSPRVFRKPPHGDSTSTGLELHEVVFPHGPDHIHQDIPTKMEVSWNGGTPKSSIIVGFSYYKPSSYWGTPISGNPTKMGLWFVTSTVPVWLWGSCTKARGEH